MFCKRKTRVPIKDKDREGRRDDYYFSSKNALNMSIEWQNEEEEKKRDE